MKNFVGLSLLVFALLMFGCGGGGTTTTSTSSNTGGAPGSGIPVSGATSSFTLNIVDGSSATVAKSTLLAAPKILSMTITQPANLARVIFRNISTTTVRVPVYDDNEHFTGTYTTVTQPTEIYKRVVDTPYTPGGSVIVAVPPSATRGYVVDVLTYYDDGQQHYNMLKYGRSAANIVVTPAGGSGNVTVNTIAPTITATPDPVNSEAQYSVTVSAGMPLRNYYKIRQDLSDVSFATFASYSSHLATGSFGARMFTTPTTYATGTLYMPAQFFIDDSMLGGAKNESYYRWTMIAPATCGVIGLVNVSFTP